MRSIHILSLVLVALSGALAYPLLKPSGVDLAAMPEPALSEPVRQAAPTERRSIPHSDPRRDSASGSPTATLGRRLDTDLDDLALTIDPDERAQRLLAVWRSAADGEVTSEVLMDLAGYRFDPDPDVARIAADAVEDLERLAEERAAVNAAARSGVDAAIPADPMSADLIATDPIAMLESPEGIPEDRSDERWEQEADGLAQRMAEVQDASPAHREAALLKLWRFGADLRASDLLAEAVAEIRALADTETDPGLQALLRRARDDLEGLATERAAARAARDGVDGERVDQEAADPVVGEADGLMGDPDRLRALLDDYGQEADPAIRVALVDAIGAVEPRTAVDLALRGIRDRDVAVRQGSVRWLWRKAADGYGDPNEIGALLREAVLDADPSVAAAASAALDDLDALWAGR